MNLQKFIPILRAVIITGAFSLLLTPFIVSNSLYFPYITGKAFFFRIVVEIIFGLWVILAVIDPKHRPKKSPVTISFLIFTAIIFFADLFGENRVASLWSNFERMDGFVTIIHLLMLLITVPSVFSKKNWIWFLNASVIASIISVIQSFNQIAEKGFEYRIDTTLGNPIYLAVFMLFSSFITLFLIAQTKANSAKHFLKDYLNWVYIIAFILQIIILFQTGTRGAMLGLLGGIFLSAVLVLVFSKGNPILRNTFFGVILAVLIFIGVIFVNKDSNFVKNTQSLHRITTISLSEGTAQARLWNWGIAWEGVKEKPLLGWGQSNYNLVYDKHFNPKMFEQEPWFDRTHNIIFDWLIAGGFLGLISYLAILISALYILWRKSNFKIVEKSILTGLIAGYFVHNLFVFDNIISYIFFIFIISFIISHSDAPVISDKEISSDNQKAISTVVILAICGAIYFINHAPYVASRDVIDAIQMFKKDGEKLMYNYDNGLDENLKIFKRIINLNTYGNPEIVTRLVSSASELSNIQNLPFEVKNKFVDYAIEQMNEQIEFAPTDSRYPYILSSLYVKKGELAKALELINRSISLAPKKQAFYFFQSQVYLNMGEKQKAIDSAKFAYELAPELDTAWSNYATILSVADGVAFEKYIKDEISAGAFDRVEKMLLQNISRKPDSYQNYISLGALYFQANQVDKSKAVLSEAAVKFPQVKTKIDQLLKLINAGENPVGKGF